MIKYEEMEPGWIQRGFDAANEDIKKWPIWMKREAGLIGDDSLGRCKFNRCQFQIGKSGCCFTCKNWEWKEEYR